MSEIYRVLVTGSRETTKWDENYIRRKLWKHTRTPLTAGRRVVIVEGRCTKGGVDLIAQRWAEDLQRRGYDVTNEGHPADWDEHGKAAGAIRNTGMVERGADSCLAFPGSESTGTWDCLIKAGKAGIETHIYPLAR